MKALLLQLDGKSQPRGLVRRGAGEPTLPGIS